jgi:UDP-sulfoquinovose synthase
MKVIVLGGDGFCGWPTTLHLSDAGHEVTIVDSLIRRDIDAELGTNSLTPIRSIEERRAAWREHTGREIGFERVDVANEYDRVLAVLGDFRPDAVIHFAEQRAAPYSMKSPRHKRFTVANNIQATHNVLCALVESGVDAHLIHLGTMGVYGYGSIEGARIPEGYLNVEIPTKKGNVATEILHPVDPGSIYHMTKTMDQLLFSYYRKNDGLRITDLHQGVVWGTNVEHTKCDERLINRFDYDGDYGTVLNRFLVQAAIGHPLTVHGSGGQKRAFIHIGDMVRAVEIMLDRPPSPGERVRIVNQATEAHRVRDLAAQVSRLTGAGIEYLDNPRKEAPENELEFDNTSLRRLGLRPTLLSTGLMEEIIDVARRYANRCDVDKIPCSSRWVHARRAGAEA